jgi:hypothetical protein
MQEVGGRNGQVSLSTVSKVLQVLEEDLIIRRQGRASELLQADELLDRLAGSYRPPRVSARKTYRWAVSRGDLLTRLGKRSRPLVLTGAASVDQYGIMPREKTLQCYCAAIEPIEQDMGDGLEESARFPDLELIETRDSTVYFDSRSLDSIPSASPVQSWLELQAGDKRQQDASVTVRKRILEELYLNGWSPP